jgi:hypothetical protein
MSKKLTLNYLNSIKKDIDTRVILYLAKNKIQMPISEDMFTMLRKIELLKEINK